VATPAGATLRLSASAAAGRALTGRRAQAGAALRVLMGAVLLLTGVMVGTKMYMDRRVAVAARIAPPKRPPGSKRRGRCQGPALTCMHPPKQGSIGKVRAWRDACPVGAAMLSEARICSHLQ